MPFVDLDAEVERVDGRTVAGDLRRRRRGRVPRPGGTRPPRGLHPGPLGRGVRRRRRARAREPDRPAEHGHRGLPRRRDRRGSANAVTPGADRPLIREAGDLERLLAEREPLYREFAAHVVDGERPARRGRRRDRGGAPLERVTVPIPGRSYDVVIGSGCCRPPTRCCRRCPVRSARSSSRTSAVAALVGPARGGARAARASRPSACRCPRARTRRRSQVYGTLLHQLAGQEAHRGRPDRRARAAGPSGDWRGSSRRPTCAGIGFVQVPTTLTGPGRRRDRGQDRREPARGQEPGRGLPPAARGPGRRRHAGGPARRATTGPGSRRSRSTPSTLDPELLERARAGARPRSSPATRRRSNALVARCVGRQGAHGGGGRARPWRPAGPQLRAHPGPRARAPRRVRRPDPRRGGRGRDGVRRPAGRGPRPGRRPGCWPGRTIC